MCGVAGVLAETGSADIKQHVMAMTESLHHRGPDAAGYWTDLDAGVALGHRRLSVIDLSANGAQPMQSACGQMVLIYNGEIYNAADLRTELERAGRHFRGHSDTEVIVEGCAHWGVRATAQRLIGMFAFATWDRSSRQLTLVRDHLGIKPMYWGKLGSLFAFGSELRALRAHPSWNAQVDRDSLAAFMRYSCVPAPYSIYRGISKLEPGCVLTVQRGSAPRVERYWDVVAVSAESRRKPFGGTATEAVDELDRLLKDAVGRALVSDVPLGAFLSGGLDSSTVVAMMQAQSSGSVKTFTIGFGDGGYDEAADAKRVAACLGVDHTEIYIDSADMLSIVPTLSSIYDEPFADASQIPTALISQVARKHVTVVLSGDGGDELFAGYTRYLWADKYWRLATKLPASLRERLTHGIAGISPRTWDRLARIVPRRYRPRQFGEKVHKAADSFSQSSLAGYYSSVIAKWDRPAEILPLSTALSTRSEDSARDGTLDETVDTLRLMDVLTYLPDDVLTKVDRASMAVALETRVPLLDRRVAEFAWSLPKELLIRNGVGKWLLRQVLYRYVPKALVERPKTGFSVPLGEWLRGPLRDWAEDLLSERALADSGLEPKPVRRLWEAILGERSWQHYALWNVLIYQDWARKWSAAPL
jgi:asparagine synthase (glutamine-hydrolysing)